MTAHWDSNLVFYTCVEIEFRKGRKRGGEDQKGGEILVYMLKGRDGHGKLHMYMYIS